MYQSKRIILFVAYCLTLLQTTLLADNQTLTPNLSFLSEDEIIVTFINKKEIHCAIEKSGAVELSVSGGTAPYSYLWSDNSTADKRTNLDAGEYSVTVSDANSKKFIASITFDSPKPITISTNMTEVRCKGESTGKATVLVTGGKLPYTYIWANEQKQTLVSTTNQANNLTAGKYFVTITDANSCFQTSFIEVSEPTTALTATITEQQATNCYGAKEGSKVALVATGGTPNYTYSWSSIGFSSSILTNAPAGNYTCSISDLYGCMITIPITVNQAPQAFLQVTKKLPVVCDSLGLIQVNALGGTAPFEYALNSTMLFQKNNQFSPLKKGTNTIYFKDANGCSNSQSIEIIDESYPLNIATTVQPATCMASDGSLSFSPITGTTPYFFELNNGEKNTTGIFQQLKKDNQYSVKIKDKNGCIATLTNLEVPSVVSNLDGSLLATAPSCHNATDGKIVIHARGAEQYTYLFNGVPNDSILTNLQAGNYQITVKDEKGCEKTLSAALKNPSAVTVNAKATNIACHGDEAKIELSATGGKNSSYQYSINQQAFSSTNAASLKAGLILFQAKDENNCVSEVQNILLKEPLLLKTTLLSTEPSKPPLNDFGLVKVMLEGGTAPYNLAIHSPEGVVKTINDIAVKGTIQTALTVGKYKTLLKDQQGCKAEVSFDIDSQRVCMIHPSVSVAIPLHCFGEKTGALQAHVEGMTIPCEYAWEQGEFSSKPILVNIGEGKYTLTTREKNNPSCAVTTTFDFQGPKLLTLKIICDNEKSTLEAKAVGGTPPFDYLWSNQHTEERINVQRKGFYSVKITDSEGCEANADIKKTDKDCAGLNLGILRGDPQNDALVIQELEPYSQEDIQVYITDRNGAMIEQLQHFQNNTWHADGLPTGTYFFIAKTQNVALQTCTGTVTVMDR
jgi:hypothetical protein